MLKMCRRGQSILEYVIILSAVVMAVIVGMKTFGKQDSSGGLGKMMSQAGERIKYEAGRIGNIAN